MSEFPIDTSTPATTAAELKERRNVSLFFLHESCTQALAAFFAATNDDILWRRPVTETKAEDVVVDYDPPHVTPPHVDIEPPLVESPLQITAVTAPADETPVKDDDQSEVPRTPPCFSLLRFCRF